MHFPINWKACIYLNLHLIRKIIQPIGFYVSNDHDFFYSQGNKGVFFSILQKIRHPPAHIACTYIIECNDQNNFRFKKYTT